MTLAPWLDINVKDYLAAMEGGANAGYQQGQLKNEQSRIAAQSQEAAGRNAVEYQDAVLRQQEQARQLQQQAQEAAAADSLQRDKLQAETEQAQQAQQAAKELKEAQMQQDALAQQQDMAFKQAQLAQTGDLSQERADMTAQRNQDLSNYQSSLNQNRSDYLDWREQQPGKTDPMVLKLQDELFKADSNINTWAGHPDQVESFTKQRDAIQAQLDKLQTPSANTSAADDLTPAPAPSLPSAPISTGVPPTDGLKPTLGDPSSPFQFSGGADSPAAADLKSPTGADPLLQDNTTSNPKGVKVKDKKTGKTFLYRGNPDDIPTDQYDILE